VERTTFLRSTSPLLSLEVKHLIYALDAGPTVLTDGTDGTEL
jgi:hypothetical protein